ncbi:hypothetical protein [Thioclava sp. GXIMD4215]|uniref:hypothetical protein n=1 Tax=Thioclava sp. GXIMD4215 TaxID=3131928 RepID=UPI003244F05D
MAMLVAYLNDTIVRLYIQNMPDHAPVWTPVGVEVLGLSTMRIEIDVIAIIS